MSDVPPEFETTDRLGTTDEFVGSVGSFAALVPPTAGELIDEFSIRCRIDQDESRRLEFSFGGTAWFRLKPGESRDEEPRGDIRQVRIRSTSASTVSYEIVMNRGLA